MRTQICLWLLFIFFLPKSLLSQDTKIKESTVFKKNQLGIQLNPFFSERLLRTGGLRVLDVVSSLRYGYRFTKNVTAGIEVSCGFPINTNSGHDFRMFNYFQYKTGLYSRYSYPAHSRFQIFAEASPYFAHYWRELISTTDPAPYSVNKFGYYVAPGLTFYSKNKKISFDLYYKFSNLKYLNGNRSVLSYKVNFNF